MQLNATRRLTSVGVLRTDGASLVDLPPASLKEVRKYFFVNFHPLSRGAKERWSIRQLAEKTG
jgi:hypothetical protein